MRKRFCLIGIAFIMCLMVGCKRTEDKNVMDQEYATLEKEPTSERTPDSNADSSYDISDSTAGENQINQKSNDISLLDNGFIEIKSGEQYDFDGDGEKETIEFSIANRDDAEEGYKLSINDVKKEGRLNMPTGKVYIGSLYSNSSLQILIDEYGYSYDYATVIFSYENNQIYELGRIGGLVEEIKRLGDGMFQFSQRAETLQTWWHPRKFYLANSYYYDESSENEEEKSIIMPKLVYMPNELYPVGTQVKLKRNIKLLKTQSLIADDVVIDRGEFITIVACDDEEWIYLDNNEGKSGWLQMDKEEGVIMQESQKVYPGDMFSGLEMAD